MTTNAVLSPSPVQRFFDNNGDPLAGGTVATYAAGTSTPIATYTDYSANTPNPNPIVLNFRGEASIWLIPNVPYKFVVQDSLGNTISTTDQISVSQLLTLWGGSDSGTTNAYVLNFTASFASLTNGIVLYWLPINTNTLGSSLNVNGLGVFPILNSSGFPITANQIQSGTVTETVYYNGAWYLIASAVATYGPLIGTFGPITSVASQTTTDLGTAQAHVVSIAGTNTITSFGNSASVQAPIYVVYFTQTLTLTNGANLTLPGGANITTAPGDAAIAQYVGSGAWRVLFYQPVIGEGSQGTFTGTLTGMGGATSGVVSYVIRNSLGTIPQVTLFLPGAAITGTSNATTMTMTGLPAVLQPIYAFSVPTLMKDNSVANLVGSCTVGISGTITFNLGVVSGSSLTTSSTGFTNSGTKGLGADWTITYPL